jgi:hypothetical protein
MSEKLLLTPIPPLPPGALPKKSVLQLLCYMFYDLNILILLSLLNFWAKPPPGEGGVGVTQSQEGRRQFLVHF